MLPGFKSNFSSTLLAISLVWGPGNTVQATSDNKSAAPISKNQIVEKFRVEQQLNSSLITVIRERPEHDGSVTLHCEIRQGDVVGKFGAREIEKADTTGNAKNDHFGVPTLLNLISVAGETNGLKSGQSLLIDLPGNGVNNELFVDVPEGQNRLEFELKAVNEMQDVDLFVRHTAPFTGIVLSDLMSSADFRSISQSGDERIVLDQVQDLQTGRWYISVVNHSANSATATLDATVSFSATSNPEIEVIFDNPNHPVAGRTCSIDEWNDPFPVLPTSLNPATTRGEARRNAFLHAAEQVRREMTGSVPVTIQACWDSLGSAVATTHHLPALSDTPQIPISNTFYQVSAAARIAGTTRCRLVGGSCDFPDMAMTFNSDIDDRTDVVFDYGLALDLSSPNGDFVAIAMHEITHGLGFLTLVDTTTGAKAQNENGVPIDDIYSLQVVDYRGGDPVGFMEMSNQQRVSAMTSGSDLQWTHSDAVQSPHNIFANQGAGFVPLYAPPVIEPGSTLSHLSESLGIANLMIPSITTSDKTRVMGISKHFLHAVGWSPTPSIPIANASGLSGLWFDPNLDGEGFNLVVSPHGTVLFYYGYNAEGQRLWLVSDTFSDKVEFGADIKLVLYEFTGGTFNAPLPSAQAIAEWGTTTMRFVNCASAIVRLDGSDGFKTSNMQKLAGIAGVDCNGVSPSASQGFSGLWYDPSLDGEGYNVINTESGMVISYYGYTSNGERLWLLTENFEGPVVPNQPIAFTIFEFKGGTFVSPLNSTDALETWGSLNVDFSPGCTTASMILNGTDGMKHSEVTKLADIDGAVCEK